MDSPQPQRQYNGIASQRTTILARLERGPATGAQLQTECNAPDPTRRIHEPREAGHLIDTE
jgi:Helix-turn-helix domain